jgi:AraC-like DNA-binding protein
MNGQLENIEGRPGEHRLPNNNGQGPDSRARAERTARRSKLDGIEWESEIIGAHFSEKEFAEHLRVSPRHLRRRFQAQSGQRLQNRMSEVRLGIAQAKLKADPGIRKEDLARQLAYAAARCLTRALKRYYGVAPCEVIAAPAKPAV